jgi:hypothetical protein
MGRTPDPARRRRGCSLPRARGRTSGDRRSLIPVARCRRAGRMRMPVRFSLYPWAPLFSRNTAPARGMEASSVHSRYHSLRRPGNRSPARDRPRMPYRPQPRHSIHRMRQVPALWSIRDPGAEPRPPLPNTRPRRKNDRSGSAHTRWNAPALCVDRAPRKPRQSRIHRSLLHAQIQDSRAASDRAPHRINRWLIFPLRRVGYITQIAFHP